MPTRKRSAFDRAIAKLTKQATDESQAVIAAAISARFPSTPARWPADVAVPRRELRK